MSSSIYAKQSPSPAVTRRPPISNEDTVNGSQRATNGRSLSDKFRSLFRKTSSSPNRTTSTDRRSTTSPVRQNSSSPGPSKSSSETPQLRTPTVSWTFGKKKPKSPTTTTSTPTTNKTKTKKDNRKKNQNLVPPMEISSPVHQPQNQTLIYGQNYVNRSPELVHGSTERLPSSSSYETTPTKGYRDYVVIDQTQQVIPTDNDVFIPPAYTNDRSRSPSMNRQPIINTNNEYYFHHDRSTPTVSIPMPDVELLSTPQRKRKVGDTQPLTSTQILADKPPISPQTSSSRPSSVVHRSNTTTNPTHWKSTSSSTLNHTGRHSSPSSSMEVDVPKLHTPSIPFGSISSKKKAKRTKSQTRADEKANSSSTINKIVQQNPLQPYEFNRNTYNSLPDAEIIYGSNLTSFKPSRTNVNRYPGLSAIVEVHMRPLPAYYNERPTRTTTTTATTTTVVPTTPQRTKRFDTSTTTLNEYEQNQPWPGPPQPTVQRRDDFIRPMTPQKPCVQPDVGVIHVSVDDLRGRTPSPPVTYRSSTTIYTRDKNNQFDNGEIRTWSAPQQDRYDHQVVPPKVVETYDEYRYSPRAHESLYEQEQRVCPVDEIESQEGEEEERFEITFEYQQQHQPYSYETQQHQPYSYETQKHYDELHSIDRYSNKVDGDKNFNYSNLTSAIHSANLIERDRIYDQSSRSYTSSEHLQEALNPVAPIIKYGPVVHTYTLKRSDTYDGLGILISADSGTRLNHFIREVEPGSPGHRAGLRRNDHIISINNINVENVDFNNVLLLIKQGLDNNNLQISVIHEPEQN